MLREIQEANDACRQYTSEIVEAVGWTGVACVQFLVSSKREVRYLETNGRFWASVQGSINAGWDFPVWLANYCLDGVTPVPPDLEVGSKTCSHADDLTLLVNFLLGGDSPSLDHTPSKRQASLNYLRAFGSGVAPDVFRWSDPLPSVVQHLKLARQFVGRARNFVAGRDNRQTSILPASDV